MPDIDRHEYPKEKVPNQRALNIQCSGAGKVFFVLFFSCASFLFADIHVPYAGASTEIPVVPSG